ncbi:MAG TPA: dihydrodipicolinate synthase family protein [Hanamia sp.]|nr:dihydrodipicolinate synthase family protein [Hanamia sp.]
MVTKKLEGIIIAMPTPLLKNEDIDSASLRRLIDYCIKEGANGIMISGSMGEGPALIDSQKQLLVEISVDHAAGRVPVLATVSAPSTRKTLEQVRAINKLGVNYIVCTTPFYYKYPDPASVILHIQKIAAITEVPLIFYNASGFTGNEVDVNTTEIILNMEKVAGVKDSSGNFKNFVELLRRYPDKNSRPGTIMQGDESVFDASLLMGADGIISGGGVVCIKLLTNLFTAGSSNDKFKAIEYQQKLTRELSKLLLPNRQRNWVHNIKNKLVEIDVIRNDYVTTPFLS